MLGDEPKRAHQFEPKWVECFEPLSPTKKRRERRASMIAEMGKPSSTLNTGNRCMRMLLKTSRRLSLSHLDGLDQDSDVDDEVTQEQQEKQIEQARPRMTRRNSLKGMGSSARQLLTRTASSTKILLNNSSNHTHSMAKYERVDPKKDGLAKESSSTLSTASSSSRLRKGSSRSILSTGSSRSMLSSCGSSHRRSLLGRGSSHARHLGRQQQHHHRQPKRSGSDNTDYSECTADVTHSSCANEATNTTGDHMGSDYDAMELLDTLDMYIEDLNARKINLEVQHETNIELAMARFKNGSRGPSTLVAMRTAMKKKAMRAMTVTTRFQLVELRKQVQKELDHLRAQLWKSEVIRLNMDIHEASINAENIVRKLDSMECPSLSDETLLQQLNTLVKHSH